MFCGAKIYKKKRGNKNMVNDEKEFKTGYSTSVKISTKQKIIDVARTLNIQQADVGRRIFEYFFEHNDVEDLRA